MPGRTAYAVMKLCDLKNKIRKPFNPFKWVKVFKNGTSKICGRRFKFFKGCLPQMLLGPFLNTLNQMNVSVMLMMIEKFESEYLRNYAVISIFDTDTPTSPRSHMPVLKESGKYLMHQMRHYNDHACTQSFSIGFVKTVTRSVEIDFGM